MTRSAIAVAVLAMSIGFAATTFTADAAGTRANATQRVATEAAEVTALRPALQLLEEADHDYKGHRAKAMEDIAQACKILGTEIKAAGTRPATRAGTRPATKPATHPHKDGEPEPQNVSDTQLHEALTIVKNVRKGIATGTQPHIAEKLDDAIKEINDALEVK